MVTPDQIAAARKRLAERWNAQGQCNSCGWHGLLYEHYTDDSEIAEALDSDGILHLGCVCEYEDRGSHRGVRVNLREPSEGSPTKPARG